MESRKGKSGGERERGWDGKDEKGRGTGSKNCLLLRKCLVSCTVEEDQQLPEVISPSASLCASRSLQLPFALPPLVLDCSLLEPSRSLHPPTLIFHPPFLEFPCSFLFTTCGVFLVTGPRFATIQSTAQARDRWRGARACSARSAPSSSCVMIISASTTTAAPALFWGSTVKGSTRRRFANMGNGHLGGF